MRSLIVQTDKQIDFIEFHINPCLKWSDEDPWSPQEGAETDSVMCIKENPGLLL